MTSGPVLDSAAGPAAAASATARQRGLRFSLSYFTGRTSGLRGRQAYAFLFETAAFADRHGFHALWMPERHFVEFGGLFPSPAVLAAALATATERVALRAGSVVVPLHHPVRLVEEWAMVDNLSDGRVGISVASGWHRDDFVLRPEAFTDRVAIARQGIEQLRRLWAGEGVGFAGVDGREQVVRPLPRPVQPELPLWISSSGTEDSFVAAGRLGTNLLTAVFNRSVDDLRRLLPLYFDALEQHGHDRNRTEVTVMLHTFLGRDRQAVHELVRPPLRPYFRSYLEQQRGADGSDAPVDDDVLDRQAAYAVEHYLRRASLLGTPESCAPLLEDLVAMGVTEVACLIDFGVSLEDALDGLELLDGLRAEYEGDRA